MKRYFLCFWTIVFYLLTLMEFVFLAAHLFKRNFGAIGADAANGITSGAGFLLALHFLRKERKHATRS